MGGVDAEGVAADVVELGLVFGDGADEEFVGDAVRAALSSLIVCDDAVESWGDAAGRALPFPAGAEVGLSLDDEDLLHDPFDRGAADERAALGARARGAEVGHESIMARPPGQPTIRTVIDAALT